MLCNLIMCGIVGYIGKQEAAPILLDGLRRLEYRGYDSAGICLWNKDRFQIIKKTGRVENLRKETLKHDHSGRAGISHTRWATHGGVSDANAHPHISWNKKLSMAHNGVIENFALIKRELEAKGVSFSSETDSEVLLNLIAYLYDAELKQDHPTADVALLKALRGALSQVEGTYGILLTCIDLPDLIIGARKGSPLVIGVGDNENFLASDVTAFAGRTKSVVYLDDGQVATVSGTDFSITTLEDVAISPTIDTISWDIEDAEMGNYPHFMLKEIFEQPMAIENSMRGRFSLDNSTAQFGGLNIEPRELRQIDRILFLGCGTAWHACLIAEYLIEKYARIPVEVEYASEFRYRNSPLDKTPSCLQSAKAGKQSTRLKHNVKHSEKVTGFWELQM
jgi:glucosamine--fructose-6-phosphate aminotransferase (isomerizing)